MIQPEWAHYRVSVESRGVRDETEHTQMTAGDKLRVHGFFNKARFGRIECHESITAYGREILLRTIELADDMGFEILHGIVDSLWVKGREPVKLHPEK